MSKLMTLLFLYRNGYTVRKYLSIETEIEKTKESYYEALATSSIGWNEGKNDRTHSAKNSKMEDTLKKSVRREQLATAKSAKGPHGL